MSLRRLHGRGQLVPTRATGIAYRVFHGIQIVGQVSQYGRGLHGRGLRPAQWVNCSVRLANAGRIPNGSYFLYTEEGSVHQLKSINGKWHYLIAAA